MHQGWRNGGLTECKGDGGLLQMGRKEGQKVQCRSPAPAVASSSTNPCTWAQQLQITMDISKQLVAQTGGAVGTARRKGYRHHQPHHFFFSNQRYTMLYIQQGMGKGCSSVLLANEPQRHADLCVAEGLGDHGLEP